MERVDVFFRYLVSCWSRFCWRISWTSKSGKEVEGISQSKGPVMVKIITMKPICNRCLWANGFKSRMTAEHGHAGIKTRIGNSCYTHFAIICGDVLYKPVNGVISITGLVDIFTFFLFDIRANIYKLTFTHKRPANILENNNEMFFHIR